MNDWMKHGACAETDPELFFAPDGERQPEREQREGKAKRICHSCPVRTDCLDYAIDRSQTGIWGGTNDDERKLLRRRQRYQASKAVA